MATECWWPSVPNATRMSISLSLENKQPNAVLTWGNAGQRRAKRVELVAIETVWASRHPLKPEQALANLMNVKPEPTCKLCKGSGINPTRYNAGGRDECPCGNRRGAP